MKGYKAFEKGLICKGKQYSENTVFEEDEAVVCKKGMHFCKNPLDVLSYYPLVDDNGNMTEFAEVEALDEPITDDNQKYCSKKLKIGGKISYSKLVNLAVAFDYESVKFEKSNCSSGNFSQIGSSGNSAKIGSSGYFAQIGSAGDFAKINSTGENSVIMCAGNRSIAKAKFGSWITLSEWEMVDGKYIPVCVKTEKVDGKRIKADTWYQLKDEEFVEVK